MIKIGLDLSDVIDVGRVPKNTFKTIGQKVLVRAADAVYAEIHRQANDNLKSSRQIYKRNINRPEIARMRATITLTGSVPNMIEQGAAPFDIKVGFSKSPKAVRNNTGGWYLTIPFRWATPDAIGENEVFSGVLPPEVYEAAKNLEEGRTMPFFGRAKKAQGLSSDILTAIGHGVVGHRAAISESAGGNLTAEERSEYEHKSPLFAGLTRQRKTYQLTTQSQYMTFRRVSDKSDKNSWIHKGIQAYNLMEKAANNVDFNSIIGSVAIAELNNAGL